MFRFALEPEGSPGGHPCPWARRSACAWNRAAIRGIRTPDGARRRRAAAPMRGHRADPSCFRAHVRDYARGVSDDACWGKRIDVNGTPLWPLIRSIDVPFPPEL